MSVEPWSGGGCCLVALRDFSEGEEVLQELPCLEMWLARGDFMQEAAVARPDEDVLALSRSKYAAAWFYAQRHVSQELRTELLELSKGAMHSPRAQALLEELREVPFSERQAALDLVAPRRAPGRSVLSAGGLDVELLPLRRRC